jgi:hypothetical protein
MYLGDFVVGATVPVYFNTRDIDAAPITLVSGTVRVYRADTDVEDDSGITLDADYDSRTGLHQVLIDTSADGTFYASGNDFVVVLTVGTVDGISVVGSAVAQFSIENRTAALMLTSAIANSQPAVGSRPSIAQGILMLTRFLMTERTISGLTLTIYQEDGSTPAMTFTLNDPSTPTSYTRAT